MTPSVQLKAMAVLMRDYHDELERIEDDHRKSTVVHLGKVKALGTKHRRALKKLEAGEEP